MTFLQAIFLGIVQGLTEFLPVSSSGHLVLARTLLGIQTEPLIMEVILHLGTLIAVLLVFYKDIIALFRHPLGKTMRLLVIATIPAVIATLLLDNLIEEAFGGRFLSFGFLITAVLLCIAERKQVRRSRKYRQMNNWDALAMGGMQAVAMFPGVSRSGSTLVGGLFRGLDRNLAVRFSFLMSIPAILGSVVFKFKDMITQGPGDVSTVAIIFSVLVSALVGLMSIRFMLRLVRNHKLYGFAIYVACMGVFVLVCQLFGVLFPPLFG